MSEWIKCSERLPEEYVIVICYAKHYDDENFSVRPGWCWKQDDKHKWVTSVIGTNGVDGQIDEVTHWMPLPSPPEDE